MVSIFIFLIIVGTAVSTDGNGWEIGKEYVYLINSQTIATLDEGYDQYTGMTFQGYMTIQPNGDDQLIARITDSLHARIQQSPNYKTELEKEDDKLDFQKLPISESPFGINLRNGVIIDLLVNKSMPTWELNILRSIVSQMQVNGRGENMIRRKRDVPQKDGLTTSFSAMEETVSGKCEVFYNITPFLESMLNNHSRLIPMPELQSNEKSILVMKTKNFSNCEQRMMYHFGFSGRNDFQLGSSENRHFFSRASESRIVITGNLKDFVIQFSETTDEIYQRLNFLDNRRGKVLSTVNLTLEKYGSAKEPLELDPDSRSTGSLVYDYNRPFKIDTSTNEHDYLQPKPTMENAPEIPLLPYFIGNGGRSSFDNKQVDLITVVTSLCNKIGNELVDPNEMMEEETLEKMTILTRLLRTMNVLELTTVQENLYRSEDGIDLENKQQLSQWNSWAIFRESVAQAGTGPALIVIKTWIQKKMITGQETAEVVSVLSKTARTPTPEYVQEFFSLIQMTETLRDKVLHRAAVLAFADLLRDSTALEKNSRYRYPVYTFGNFTLNATNPLFDKYLRYLSDKLEEAIERGRSADIQTFTSVIARVNHPKILKTLEPYLENSLSMTTFQRAWMVLSLNKFATSWPAIVRPILFKIYRNTDDFYEVRCAAVFVLMMTEPPESMLKDMANYTNYDPSDRVSSAVKTYIKSVVDFGNDSEFHRIVRLAAPLLAPKIFDDEYSMNMIINFASPKTDHAFNQYIHMLGSDGSMLTKSIYTVLKPRLGSLETPTGGWGASFSSLEPLIRAFKEIFGYKKKNGPESDTKKWTAENIARVLKVAANDDTKFEGNVFLDNIIHHFIPFDGSSLENIPDVLEDTFESLKKGLSINKVSYKDYNMELSFPIESGFPYVFTFEIPTVHKINIKSQVINDKTAENKSYPYTADFHTKMDLSHAVKIQGRSGFVTPFDNTHYMAGFDGQFQLYLPLQSKVKYNLHDNRYGMKMQPLESGEIYRLFQLRSIPFITHLNMMKLDPVTKIETTEIVTDAFARRSKNVALGISYEIETDWPSEESEQKMFENKSPESSQFGLISTILYWKFAIVWTTKFQKDEFLKLNIVHDSIRNSSKQYDDSSGWTPDAKIPEIADKEVDSQGRREYLLKKAIESINFGRADVLDVGVELVGSTNWTFVSTVAYGTSDVDIKSRLLFHKGTFYKQIASTESTGAIDLKSPRITALNPGKMLKSNLSMDFDAKLRMKDQSHEILKLHGSVGRSQERQKELLEREEARNCLKEYEAGNKALIACDNITALADFYDEMNVTVNLEETVYFQNVMKEVSRDLKRAFRNIGMETNEVSPKHKDENRIDYSFRITGQNGLDISVFNPNMDMKVKNLRRKDVQKLVFGPDTFLETETRKNELDELAASWKTPACIVGESNVKTFDGVNYPLEMNECWHVFFTTYPQWKPWSNHNSKLPIPYNLRTSIIGKNAQNDRREFKVNLGPDEIYFYIVDSGIKIEVNDESVEVNDEKSFQRQIEDDVAFEIYLTSNRSVALVSNEHEVKIEYDGKHLRVEVSDLYYKSIGGLCGDYDGRLKYDLADPSKLSTKNPKYFAETWSLQQEKNPSVENITEGTCFQ